MRKGYKAKSSIFTEVLFHKVKSLKALTYNIKDTNYYIIKPIAYKNTKTCRGESGKS